MKRIIKLSAESRKKMMAAVSRVTLFLHFGNLLGLFIVTGQYIYLFGVIVHVLEFITKVAGNVNK